MNKLKKLQNDYKAGKLTEAAYKAAVKDLLDDEDVTQEEHDAALEFDPEEDGGGNEKPIYTQSDMDNTIMKKARQLVRKELKAAGVDVADIKPQGLLGEVAKLAAAGTGKAKETDTDLIALRKKAAAFDKLEPANKALVVENAVLKSAAKLNPINPAQVVRALNADYAELLDYDEETGALDPKSVQKALKRIAEVEPNLFVKPEDTDPDEGGDDQLDNQQAGANFSGKPPGGAGTGSTKQTKEAAKLATGKAAALEMMGIKQEK